VAPGQVAGMPRIPSQKRGGQKGRPGSYFCQNFERE
jgi:hypothetical protein